MATAEVVGGGFVTLARGAKRAGVSRATLDRAAASAELPYAVIGETRYFAVQDVDRWAAWRSTGKAGSRPEYAEPSEAETAG